MQGTWPQPIQTPTGAVVYGVAGNSARMMLDEKAGGHWFYRSSHDGDKLARDEAQYRDSWVRDHGDVALVRASIGIRSFFSYGIAAAIITFLIAVVTGAGVVGSLLSGGAGFALGFTYDVMRRVFTRYDLVYAPADENGVPEWGVPFSPVDFRGLWNVNYYGEAANWEKGARGEELVGEVTANLPAGYAIFHDVAVPGSNANADHVVVTPHGIVFVDAKNWNRNDTITPGNAVNNPGGYENPVPTIQFEMNSILDASGLSGVPHAVIVCVTGNTAVESGLVSFNLRTDRGDLLVGYTDLDNLVNVIAMCDERFAENNGHASVDAARALHSVTEPAMQ